MDSFKEAINAATAHVKASDVSAEELMQNDDYLRDSQAIVNDALKEGFDVLQLENGDIVTTGTKVVVNQYRWDNDTGKMTKLSEEQRQAEQSENEE